MALWRSTRGVLAPLLECFSQLLFPRTVMPRLAWAGIESAEESENEPERRSAWLGLWDGILNMAVPKKKTSHSRKLKRATHKQLHLAVNIVQCPTCGSERLMHHVCANCRARHYLSEREREMQALKDEKAKVAEEAARRAQLGQ